MEFVTVARAAEVAPGQTRSIQTGGRLILLVNDGGTFYALQGLCGHQNLPPSRGRFWQGTIDCPWHHFQYDLKTGENLYPRRIYPLDALPRLRQQVQPLQTYPVRVVNGELQVGLSNSAEELQEETGA
jgi:nitrite reductase/ring-hydroxylating ferredoxin subunit